MMIFPPVQVTVTVPEPVQDCSPVSVALPTVECQDITEEKCVLLPLLQEAEVAATECRAVLGPPDCKAVRRDIWKLCAKSDYYFC